jgi:hypothetical protein
MPEIAQFVQRGSAMITPNILKGVHKRLPFLKLKFTEFDDPAYPHLSEQLEFLANVVEDFVEGVEDDLAYSTVLAAAFALVYADRQIKMIPEDLPEPRFANDSAVVRAVLTGHEKVLIAYASRHELQWEAVSLLP